MGVQHPFSSLAASHFRSLLDTINSSTLDVSVPRHVSLEYSSSGPAPLTMPSPYAPLQCPRSHTQAPADVESNQFISLLINSRCKCDASFWKNINPDAKMTSIRNTAFCKGKGLEPNRGATVCEPAFGRHRGNECIEGPVGGQSGQPMSAAPGACAGVGRRGSGAWLMLFVKVHYLLL